MSLRTKVFLSMVFGTVGAMLAWVLVDFNGVYRLSDESSFLDQLFVGVIFGGMMGIAIGTVNGLSSGSMRRMWRNIGWGALVGLVGGALGLIFGQKIFETLYTPNGINLPILGFLQFMWNVMVRAIGWALIGLFIGMSPGIANGSPKMRRHGAAGGFIGGFLGGMFFEIIPFILPSGVKDPGVICRGISMTMTGAFIGLLIGLVENMMKQAWVRVIAGRNEGREYIISKAQTSIGRNEMADIPLFGDRNIAPLHAIIYDAAGERHILKDAGTPSGTMVSGQRIQEHLLRDGELIQIGSMRLEFHEKATASRVARPQADVASRPSIPLPTTPDRCPFCGGKKDPTTGACACSFNGTSAGPAPGIFSPPAASQMQGGARLVCTSGPYSGQTFPLSPTGTTSVGRETDRSIQLSTDSTVSRRHARIANEGGIYVVYDEGSSNGTGVNGVNVGRQELRSGDTISFGSSSFRLEE